MSFTPFDDTLTPRRYPRATTSGSSFPYDHLRQGIEITTAKYLYAGSQPKFWAGANNFVGQTSANDTLDHAIKIVTYGQALGFVDYDGHSIFEDLPKYDPVSYITLGDDYPLPIVLNEGPMQQDEAIIEPFTIPFRLKTNEGPIYARSPGGELEDGNNFLDLKRGANRIEQFIDLQDPLTPVYFLDLGQEEFGNIRIDGFVTGTQRLSYPFDDTQQEFVVATATTTDETFIATLKDLDINNDEDLRPYKKKSANAGFCYVGSQMGTDSISFGGYIKGY